MYVQHEKDVISIYYIPMNIENELMDIFYTKDVQENVFFINLHLFI